MATTAKTRVYRTVDGELVGEGDRRGAFLAYNAGDEVNEQDAESYRKLVAEDLPAASDVAREALMARERRAVPTEPAFVHERALTEAADEMRVQAARGQPHPELVSPGGVVARHRVSRTEDGELVRETDPLAATLAYPVGAEVPAGEANQYRRLFPDNNDADQADEDNPAADESAKADESTRPPTKTAAAKARLTADNK